MSDIEIRIEGRAGRITLRRPQALNALSYDMAMAIETALDVWASDDAVSLLLLDAEGDKAFCAGGDVTDLYRRGVAGDLAYGRRFWRDEYRMNRKLFHFPKPVVALMQGYVMGGGVGIGCHGSHRVVCDSTRMAMPECGIGLVPDVGGSLLLAQAPGRLGEYVGLTGYRMGPGDAIHTGFADYHVPQGNWPGLIAELCKTGDVAAVDRAAGPVPEAPLAARAGWIAQHFGGERLGDVLRSLRAAEETETLDILARQSPLSMACTLEMIHRLQGPAATFERAQDMEYRFVYNAMEHGDFLEGVRAALIDKDRAPKWRHGLDEVSSAQVSRMLRPLGKDALTAEDGQ